MEGNLSDARQGIERGELGECLMALGPDEMQMIYAGPDQTAMIARFGMTVYTLLKGPGATGVQLETVSCGDGDQDQAHASEHFRATIAETERAVAVFHELSAARERAYAIMTGTGPMITIPDPSDPGWRDPSAPREV